MSLFDLHTYDSLESTNLLVRERIEANEREGFTALAFEQTAGYGRLGRAWASPAGGLYMSVLLRPNVDMNVLPTISFLVAIAVRRALAHVLSASQLKRVQLKWPNDIVLVGEGADDVKDVQRATRLGAACIRDAQDSNDDCAKNLQNIQSCRSASCVRSTQSASNTYASNTHKTNVSRYRFNKLVGISQELVHGALCIGIGANVYRPAKAQNVTGKNTPVYIAELAQTTDLDEIAHMNHMFSESKNGVSETNAQSNSAKIIRTSEGNPDYANLSDQQEQKQFITRLARLILQELEPVYTTWQARGFEPFLDEYKHHMCLLGQNIQMQNQYNEQTFEGTVAGINSAGQLLLIDPSGHTKNVTSGEVTLF